MTERKKSNMNKSTSLNSQKNSEKIAKKIENEEK